MPLITAKSSTYRMAGARRIGVHHFAHLRAVAEGLPLLESAERYLGIDHGHQAITAHRAVVDELRNLARRRGDRAWRLVGLNIRLTSTGPRPSLDDFIAERDLDDWGEAEVQEMYAEAYPADRRAERRQRLRERQLALLKALEQAAAETPQPTDPINGWFDPVTARRLQDAGLLLLSDLLDRIAAGGHWWRGLPAIGQTKAQRICSYLHTLLPAQAPAAAPRFLLPSASIADGHPALPGGQGSSPLPHPPAPTLARPQGHFPAPQPPENRGARTAPDGRSDATQGGWQGEGEKSPGGPLKAFSGDFEVLPHFSAPTNSTVADQNAAISQPLMTSARDDVEIIEAWVAARAGALPTAASYRREARRMLIWLNQERGKGFRDTQVEDCLAYMAFLEHVPPAWSSRQRAHVLAQGWAPFRGPLSLASRRQAVVVLGSFFAWMVDVGWLSLRNPWMLVNRRTGDDATRNELDSRAFTPEVWSAIHDFLARQPNTPSLARIRFLLTFVEATGLRAAELLNARLGHFRRHKGRLALQVQGKGSRNRVIAVPGQAEQALATYLQARGLPALGQADTALPLLASTQDPTESIGYQALYQTMKRWMRQALLASALDKADLEDALRASPHWLRHTFGTRALERKAPLEVVQRQLGHADPRTTMRYAKAQLERLQAEMDQVFGVVDPSLESPPTGRGQSD